jgi:copper(I)-binding protein
MKKILLGLVLLVSSLGVAFAADDSMVMAQASLAANNIVVKSPEILLMQKDDGSAEAFMELDNKGNQTAILIAANSMTANQTLLHKMVERNDIEVMKPVNKILIRAHSDTELQTGGFHVMLMGLKQTLHKGDAVPILLIFNDGSSLTVHAVVG